ncbi:MAG TPA: gamma-glutamyl-gamma-aminobutyrate hydrolase family protein [Thermoanaerobaculia bacterium]|nr:gamma-glutamyl-gamma-aminobutyrate hydrolase family protein [Thermoanaerobaculia bacterium]
MSYTDKVILAAGDRQKGQVAVEALKQVGLEGEKMHVLLASDGEPDPRALAARAAGLVLLGGPDIDPRYFGEEPLAEARLTIDPARDAMEWELLAGAREARVPTWGICRGFQVIDVFFGGTLWQDIPTQCAGPMLHDLSYPRDALIHPVVVDPAGAHTALAELLSRETALVNSRHHQGVKDVPDELTIVGRAPDGLVEAFVLEEGPWWLEAVQWHPENLVPLAQQRALAERFLAAVDRFERERHALDPHVSGPFYAQG